MQVFNVFMKVFKRNAIAAVIYMTAFIVFAVIMTYSDSAVKMFEATSLDICVIDADNTPESRALYDFLGEKHRLVELTDDRDTVIDALYYETVDYILTIKQGYAEKLASGSTDDLFSGTKMHDSYSTVYMGQFLNEYASTVSAYMAGGCDTMTALAKTREALSQEAEVTVVKFGGNEGAAFSQIIGFYFRFMPFIMLGSVMNTLCPVLMVLGRKEIRSRTDCSGIPQSRYITELFGASALYIIAEWLIFMIVGMIFNGGVFTGAAWIGVLNSFVFMLFVAALTIFISSFNPTINVINIITQVVSIGMSFLCGIFVELDLLGDGVIAAARFLPAYWYMRVNRMLTGTEAYDAGLAAVAIGIEAAFAVVFAVLTLLIRRVRYTGKAARLSM